MIPKKSLGIIIGGAAAGILILVVVLGQSGFLKNIEAGVAPEQKAPLIQEHSPFSAYKINTECELIYGFASGKYPDNGKIAPIKTSEIFTKYSEFDPWKKILENNETRAEFFKKPLPSNFTDALVTVIMKETSINPDLKSIVSLISDPQGKAKLQDAYQQYNCKPYFDQRSKQ